MANYWWVNQGRSHDVEKAGGYLFAAAASHSGREVPSWKALKDMLPGDTVFLYCQGVLRSLGKVTGAAQITEHPKDEQQGTEVNTRRGYTVPVDYFDIEPPVALDEIPLELRDPKLGPFTKGRERVGLPQQGYAFPLSKGFLLGFKKAFPDRLPIDPW